LNSCRDFQRHLLKILELFAPSSNIYLTWITLFLIEKKAAEYLQNEIFYAMINGNKCRWNDFLIKELNLIGENFILLQII